MLRKSRLLLLNGPPLPGIIRKSLQPSLREHAELQKDVGIGQDCISTKRFLKRNKRLHVKYLIDRAKRLYLQEKVSSNKRDPKNLFRTISGLFCTKTSKAILPNYDSPQHLATRFATFFTQKIAKIHTGLAQSMAPGPQPLATEASRCSSASTPQKFSSFTPATTLEISKLIMKSPSASRCLDPIPTWLLKENLDLLLPIYTPNAVVELLPHCHCVGATLIAP